MDPVIAWLPVLNVLVPHRVPEMRRSAVLFTQVFSDHVQSAVVAVRTKAKAKGVNMWAVNFILGLCAIFIALNWLGLVACILEGRSYSFAPPLLAGVVGSLFALGHASPTVNAFAWAPLVLDPSIGFVLGSMTVAHLRKFWTR